MTLSSSTSEGTSGTGESNNRNSVICSTNTYRLCETHHRSLCGRRGPTPSTGSRLRFRMQKPCSMKIMRKREGKPRTRQTDTPGIRRRVRLDGGMPVIHAMTSSIHSTILLISSPGPNLSESQRSIRSQLTPNSRKYRKICKRNSRILD